MAQFPDFNQEGEASTLVLVGNDVVAVATLWSCVGTVCKKRDIQFGKGQSHGVKRPPGVDEIPGIHHAFREKNVFLVPGGHVIEQGRVLPVAEEPTYRVRMVGYG